MDSRAAARLPQGARAAGALIFFQIGNDSETSLFALQGATDAVANQAGS